MKARSPKRNTWSKRRTSSPASARPGRLARPPSKLKPKLRPKLARQKKAKTPNLLYLYGIFEAKTPIERLLAETGVPGMVPELRVFPLEAAGLVAAVSDV